MPSARSVDAPAALSVTVFPFRVVTGCGSVSTGVVERGVVATRRGVLLGVRISDAAEGITGGCGDGTAYCPTNPVLRQQMAVLLLRTFEGASYTPPACVTPTFSDVPCSSNFAPWIYELVARNITAGCGGGKYCPTDTANRGQMATFVVKTFSLP